MAKPEPERKGGISPQTLIVASLASGAAALITSQLWEGGKVVSAIVTPIIVTLVGELLHRPVERISSATVLRQAPRAVGIGAAPAVGRGRRAAAGGGAPEPGPGDPVPDWARGAEPGTGAIRDGGADGNGPAPSAARELDAPPVGDGAPVGPRRVYSKRRPVRVRLVVAAGLAAFAIAAAALTVPELVAGDAIGGEGRTTLFGGSDLDSERGAEREDGGRDGRTDAPAGEDGGRSGQSGGGGGDPAPDDGAEPAPEAKPAPAPAPNQGAPAPAPSSPSAPAP